MTYLLENLVAGARLELFSVGLKQRACQNEEQREGALGQKKDVKTTWLCTLINKMYLKRLVAFSMSDLQFSRLVAWVSYCMRRL